MLWAITSASTLGLAARMLAIRLARSLLLIELFGDD